MKNLPIVSPNCKKHFTFLNSELFTLKDFNCNANINFKISLNSQILGNANSLIKTVFIKRPSTEYRLLYT